MKLKLRSYFTKLPPVCGLAVLLLNQTAEAQFTYAGGTLNAAQTYDGLGVDSASNPKTIGSASSDNYIGNGAAGLGSITVQSGTLTMNGSDTKIAQWNGSGVQTTGTVSVATGATLNINQIGLWGGGVGQRGVGTINIGSGATLNWQTSGSTEQRFMFGNGASGIGILNLNGGLLYNFFDPLQALTDAERQFRAGSDGGAAIINLNSGNWFMAGAVPFVLGAKYNSLNTTPNLVQSATESRIHVLNGNLVMSNTAPVLDGVRPDLAGKAAFVVGANDYVNFIPGGTGSLSLLNWSVGDYENYVTNGWIRVGSNITTIASFQYSTSGGQGVLKVGSVIVGTPTISPSNICYAGETVILSVSATGGSPFTYKWQTDNGSGGVTFSDISGATFQNYTNNTTGLLGAYQYRVILTNSVSVVSTSAVVTLTVNAASAPFLTADTTPAAVSRYVGGYVTFNAAFDGNHPIAYQWQVDGGSGYTNIPGATATSLTISNLQFANAGAYQLTATNSIDGGISTPATLMVLDPAGLQFSWSAPVPFNGLNANQILTNVSGGATGIVGAAVFGNTPLSVTLASGHVVQFKNDGSVATTTGFGPAAVAYPAGTGNTTGNANFDAVLNQFRYDGGPHTITLNGLIPGERYAVQLFAVDNRGDGTAGSISNRLSNFQDGDDAAISIETSATYKMGDNAYVIGTFYASNSTETIQQNLPTGNNGNINALVIRALSFTPAGQPPVITLNPASKTVFTGHTAQFTVAADSYVVPTYQWQAGPAGGPYTNINNGVLYAGTTTAGLTVNNVSSLNGAEFLCNVSNPAGTTPSSAALLTVIAAPASSGTAASAVLTLNPVAYWPLNENFDVTGGGMPAYEAVSGKDGEYLIFAQNAFNSIVGPQAADGHPQFAAGQGALRTTANTDQTWVITPALDLNTNTVTIGMWIYPDGVQPNACGLFVNRNAGTRAGLGYYGTDRLGYKWNDDAQATWNFNSGLLIPVNVWSFVAVVVEPTKATLYLYNTISGLQSAVNTTTHTNQSWGGAMTNIRIGRDSGANTVFNGNIDEVAVFNRALSQAEVLQLAAATPTVSIQPSGANVLVTWPFGTLLEATSVTGPWTTNVNVSPYTFAPTGAQKFFRVQTQ